MLFSKIVFIKEKKIITMILFENIYFYNKKIC